MGRLSSPQTHLPKHLPVFEKITMVHFFYIGFELPTFAMIMYNIYQLCNAGPVSANPTKSSANKRSGILFLENLTPNSEHFSISFNRPLI